MICRSRPMARRTGLTTRTGLRRATPLPREPAARARCSAPECERPARRGELCGMHYQRQRRHGDINAVGRPGLREEVRFARATRRGEPSSHRPDLGPCLIYLGADNGNGYGQFRYNGRNGYAHRYAWERVNGDIPDGLTIDHLCRVRRCVEVTHMEPVDAVTNFRRGVESWTTCRSGRHKRTPENTYVHGGRRYCIPCRRDRSREAGVRRRNPPGTPDPRVRYDQELVRAEIALVRNGVQSIAQAARVIGCNPNYLGRRIWRETRRDVLERDHNLCVRCGRSGDLDVHHRRPRGSGGTSLPLISFGQANLLSLCRPCHQDVTVNPAVARERGWSVLSTTDPAVTPVWLAGRGWSYLRPDGSVAPAESEVS